MNNNGALGFGTAATGTHVIDRSGVNSRASGLKRILLVILTAQAVSLQADDVNAPAATNSFFESRIRPLLAENCHECHGRDKSKGGLRLDTRTGFLAGGSSGPLVDHSNPRQSLILRAIRGDDPDFHMPPSPGRKLTAAEVVDVEKWVVAGDSPVWPVYADEAVREGETGDDFSVEERSWWAIQPVQSPDIPSLAAGLTARNPVDHFIHEKLRAAGLRMAPEASRGELLRRASYDLTGLPPSVEMLNRFMADTRPDAWERVVDELLDSPAYGERWGQHWLDVTRWAESDGYRADDFRPHAWPYRDYVIRSFNEDKSYRQFIREHVAGDELAPDDPDSFIGAAFLRNGIYEWNQREVRMHWDLIVTEVTDLTAEVFMGLGLRCARCHDHKFDPIRQEDYFRFKALLAPIRWNHRKPLATPEQIEEHRVAQKRWEQETAGLRARIDAILEPRIRKKEHAALIMFPEDIQAMFAKTPEQRSPYEQQLVELASFQLERERRVFKPDSIKGEDGEKLGKLMKELAQFDHLKPEPLPPAHIAVDVGPEAPSVFMETRSGKREVPPGFLSILDPSPLGDHDFPGVPGGSSGRRTRLAEWLANDSNPLTARVYVNRIWQNHFGRGLAPNPNDFGTLGGPPSHPELLDWITSQFLQSGWKTKPIHRIIMTSAAYRQTARPSPEHVAASRQVDPANSLLWRFSPARLSAEQVRDGMLAVSGELDPMAGGPSVSHDTPRRSIYVRKKRNTPVPMFREFDAPDGFDSIPQRTSTTTPAQALLILNDEWPIARAQALAQRLMPMVQADPEAGISWLVQAAWSRNPRPDELRLMDSFLGDGPTDAPVSEESLTDLCHMILTSNEFLYLH